MHEKNYAREQVKRICRNVIISMLLLGGIVGVLLFKVAANPMNLYWRNARVKDFSDIEGSYEHNLFWVEAKAGYMDMWYTVSEDKRIISYYYFWHTDDGYVCVQSNARTLTEEEYENVTLIGWLSRPDEDDAEAIRRFTEEVKDYYSLTYTEAAEWISPYVIHVSTPKVLHQVITGVGYLFLLFVLWRILQSILLLGDYRRSKHYKKLGCDEEERERVNTQISAELEMGQFIIDKGQTKITRKWVLQGSGAAFTARPLDELVWVYGNVTQHRTNGIPTGKTYALLLNFINGKSLSLSVKNEMEMNGFLAQLQSLGGNRLFGFSPELRRVYDKDRQGFLDMARRDGEQQRCREAEGAAPGMDEV